MLQSKLFRRGRVKRVFYRQGVANLLIFNSKFHFSLHVCGHDRCDCAQIHSKEGDTKENPNNCK